MGLVDDWMYCILYRVFFCPPPKTARAAVAEIRRAEIRPPPRERGVGAPGRGAEFSLELSELGKRRNSGIRNCPTWVAIEPVAAFRDGTNVYLKL